MAALRSWRALLAGLFFLSSTSVALADGDRERAAAREAANAGADAFDAGNYERAVELFTRAEELFHAPPHLLFKARALEKLGRLVEAREAYLKLVREKLPADAPRPFKDAQAAGAEELRAVEGRLAYVTLTVQGDSEGQAVVSMNGVDLPRAMVGIPVPVDPGTYVFSARSARARSSEVTVTVGEGNRKSVDLTLTAALDPAGPVEGGTPSSGALTDDRVESRASSGSTQRVIGYVTLGAGVVMAGVGGGFLVSWLSAKSEADTLYACDSTPMGCTSEQIQEIDRLDADARAARPVAIAGLAVGGAVIATGLVLVLTAGPAETPASAAVQGPQIRFVAGPAWIGASGTF